MTFVAAFGCGQHTEFNGQWFGTYLSGNGENEYDATDFCKKE